MIKIEDQRELAIKILTFNKPKYNLFVEFDQFVKDPEDVFDIAAFLDPYKVKHSIDYYEFDLANGDCVINNPLLPILLNLIVSFSPTNFERLSALLLFCFDYPQYFITKRTHDYGIDLIAYSDHFKNYFSINSTYRHYIFGQCKKYKKNHVSTTDITALCGSMELFRMRTFPVKNPEKVYSNFRLNMYTPIHLIFFSGYFFGDDATTLCNNADIISIDVLDVTLILLKNLEKLSVIKKDGALNKSKIKTLLNSIKVEK